MRPRSRSGPLVQFAVVRKTGYISTYPWSMLCGTAVLAPNAYRQPYPPVLFRIRNRWWPCPWFVVQLSWLSSAHYPGTVRNAPKDGYDSAPSPEVAAAMVATSEPTGAL
ncbi:hypothetical protein [Leucobacter sp. cx-169]|uniref:hypothetical protein n=1 Tax=Leucobacter sp. cx-169 TaxID=2770549 RepID=UPI00165D846F|nr:hypothetical protein [Leucobacter sp. cx-169]MBC9927257.1 hypothetical protein [Leucobacter sp. cx-169]